MFLVFLQPPQLQNDFQPHLISVAALVDVQYFPLFRLPHKARRPTGVLWLAEEVVVAVAATVWRLLVRSICFVSDSVVMFKLCFACLSEDS